MHESLSFHCFLARVIPQTEEGERPGSKPDKSLQLIDAQTPVDRDLHLILDNYATHKHPKVQKWLAKHPRFHLHFTPTSASWLNIVEHQTLQRTRPRFRALRISGTMKIQRALSVRQPFAEMILRGTKKLSFAAFVLTSESASTSTPAPSQAILIFLQSSVVNRAIYRLEFLLAQSRSWIAPGQTVSLSGI
jgi:hypothetical protein